MDDSWTCRHCGWTNSGGRFCFECGRDGDPDQVTMERFVREPAEGSERRRPALIAAAIARSWASWWRRGPAERRRQPEAPGPGVPAEGGAGGAEQARSRPDRRRADEDRHRLTRRARRHPQGRVGSGGPESQAARRPPGPARHPDRRDRVGAQCARERARGLRRETRRAACEDGQRERRRDTRTGAPLR